MEKKRCNCIDIKVGTYNRQIWVHSPAHMPKDNGYCLDLCIAQEVMQLWLKGIITEGCCCGHNYLPGYIQVTEEFIPEMIALGYELANFRGDCFTPKYNSLL